MTPSKQERPFISGQRPVSSILFCLWIFIPNQFRTCYGSKMYIEGQNGATLKGPVLEASSLANISNALELPVQRLAEALTKTTSLKIGVPCFVVIVGAQVVGCNVVARQWHTHRFSAGQLARQIPKE